MHRWFGLLMVFTPGLWAAPGWQPLAALEAAAVAALRDVLPATARLEAVPVDARLRLPACDGSLTAEPAPGSAAAQRRVLLRCAEPAWTVPVMVRVSDPRSVLTLARAGQRGTPLSADLVESLPQDVARLPFGHFERPEELAGLQLRRNLPAGSVLSPNDVEPVRLVQRGSPVTLVAEVAGIAVTAGGVALADAGAGQRVRVRNERSGRIVEGEVLADGRVAVR